MANVQYYGSLLSTNSQAYEMWKDKDFKKLDKHLKELKDKEKELQKAGERLEVPNTSENGAWENHPFRLAHLISQLTPSNRVSQEQIDSLKEAHSCINKCRVASAALREKLDKIVLE